ncbi:MAG: DNA-binding protein [Candidatus Micrarchaeota archaeon]
MEENSDPQLEQLKQMREQELKIRTALKAILDANAFERLSLMRLSNSSLYSQVAGYLFSLYSAGKIRGKVNEEQLKQISQLFLAQRKETTIKRLSK